MVGIRMSFVVFASCMAVAAVAGPAGASVVSFRADGAAITLAIPAANSKIPVVKDKSTAGYISEKSGIKTVSTTFEVPEITNCTAGHTSGMGPVVILVGPGYFVGAGAEAECRGGVTSYLVAINHNGSETHPLTVAAKDKISVDVTIESKVVFVKIEDLTTKKTASQSLPKGKVTAAELGDDSLTQSGQRIAIPKFTDHQFTDDKINGKVLKDATPLTDEELVRGKTLLIEPGPLNKAGDLFVMKFEHAT